MSVTAGGGCTECCAECAASPRGACNLHRPRNPAAVALGRLGGHLGGLARARVLSPARRHEISRLAAHRRWHTGAFRTCVRCQAARAG